MSEEEKVSPSTKCPVSVWDKMKMREGWGWGRGWCMMGEEHSICKAMGARIKIKMCCFVSRHNAVCIYSPSSGFNCYAYIWFSKTLDLISVICFIELCIVFWKTYLNFYYIWKEFYCLKYIKIKISNSPKCTFKLYHKFILLMWLLGFHGIPKAHVIVIFSYDKDNFGAL